MSTPLHPMLVHLPLALGVLMPLVAAALVLAWWRGWLPGRAWWLAVALQAVLVGSGLVALRTGEADEDRVETTAGEAAIDAHEDAAHAFVAAGGAVFALMLLATVMGERRSGLSIAALSTVGAVMIAGLGVRTGSAGGALVHGGSVGVGGPSLAEHSDDD